MMVLNSTEKELETVPRDVKTYQRLPNWSNLFGNVSAEAKKSTAKTVDNDEEGRCEC